MATFLSYRISAISTFCRPTTRTPSITNRLVAIAYTKRVIANCIPKLVAMATSLSTSGPHLKHDSLGPSKPITQTASRSVQLFCTDDCRVSLYYGTPLSPLKIVPSHGGSGPPSNTWFPGPTRVFNPNCISISSAIFAELTSVTDRPTDHSTR